MTLDFMKNYEIRIYLSLSLELFHFYLYRFLSQGFARFCGLLVKKYLDQEVWKTSNYSDKLVHVSC